MRILHANALTSPAAVDGVNSTIWSVATEQAHAGHNVSIVLGTPAPDAVAFAERHGVRLRAVGSSLTSYAADLSSAIKTHQIEVVHLHSTFSVRLTVASIVASRLGVCQVMTPHGALSPPALGRSRRKKQVYAATVERRRLERASVITTLHLPEQRHVQRFVPRYGGRFAVVPVPVQHFDVLARKPLAPGPIVFLGRYDLYHKGLDRWLEIACQVPERQFALYGSGPDHDAIKARLPANVALGDPIYDSYKHLVLSRASMYLQSSRWEGFPISVAEAMQAGTPIAITDSIDIAELVAEHDLGLVLPSEPNAAAVVLRAALVDGPTIARRAANAKSYAQKNFTPPNVAAAYVQAYADGLRLRGDQ